MTFDRRGLVLLQPDIALDVFRSEIRAAQPLPGFTAVVAAQTDPALRVSARVSQSEICVGAYTKQQCYGDLGIRLIDVSQLRDARQPHLVAFSSRPFLENLNQIQRSGDI